MRYFCRNDERSGTEYHEFYKGEWKDGDGFWHDGSLLLHDGLMRESGLRKVFAHCITAYEPYAEVIVMPDEWADVISCAKEKGGMAAEIVDEAEPWIHEVFEEYGCFTILGI